MVRSWLHAVVPLLAVLLAVACTSDPSSDAGGGDSATSEAASGATASGTPWVPLSVTPPPPRTPTAEPTSEPTPGPPYLERFERGEVIDVSPAVVFGDAKTGEAEAWVFPGAVREFVVSPGGGFVIYRTDDGFKLLRTEDGAMHDLGIGAWPVELGPGDSGFMAVDSDRFVLSTYDGEGRRIQDLWRSARGVAAVASWSEDGSIAVGQNNTESAIAVSVWAAPGWVPPAPGDEFSVAVPAGSLIALEWSPDGELVAVVTSDAVYALDRDNNLVWTVAGEFVGNPRWSADGAYLAIHGESRVTGRSGDDVGSVIVTYLLTRAGDEQLRVVAGGACAGDPWLDERSFNASAYRVGVDGLVSRYDGPSPNRWERASDLGFEIASGIGHHFPHIAERDDSHRLDDGRFVFTTPGIGHGGCGEWSGASESPAVEVERPPYEPILSGRAAASHRLAAEPAVVELLDSVLDARRGEQVPAIIALAHRYEAPCALHGDVNQWCEADGLGESDTFAALASGFEVCTLCYFPARVVESELAELDEAGLRLEAIWRFNSTSHWPYVELDDGGTMFAVWFQRSDWRRLDDDDLSGVLLIVNPRAASPVAGVERYYLAWTPHDTAQGLRNWEPIYLARPGGPRD